MQHPGIPLKIDAFATPCSRQRAEMLSVSLLSTWEAVPDLGRCLERPLFQLLSFKQ